MSGACVPIKSWKKRPTCLLIKLGGYLFNNKMTLILSNSDRRSSGWEHIRAAQRVAAYGIFLVM